jgi:hypothetical protein
MQGFLTVGQVIEDLLPWGSRYHTGTASAEWSQCPVWPPDVFAVTATIAHLSGCYAEPGLVLSRTASERKKKQKRAEFATRIGRVWSDSSNYELPEIQKLWEVLIAHTDELLCVGAGKGNVWKRAALQLLAIADEACAGVGYEPTKKSVNQTVSEFIWEQIRSFRPGKRCPLELPNSLAHLVPADICCVLPKAMTPEVGCTLRSLSHHLALLPGLGVVRTEWYVGDSPGRIGREAVTERKPISKPLNLLLVPFPFVVHASDFEEARAPEPGVDGYFRLKQGWLKDGRRKLTPSQIATFVTSLIRSAQKDIDQVHGVIFPEAAFDERLASGVAKLLLRRLKKLEFVICGALTTDGSATRNEAIIFRLVQGDFIAFRQSKHHRWRLDGRQILQYHLGGSLDPKVNWWEQIDVHNRTLQFSVDSHEAVIAALVCEDLARHEPVLSVVSAIGPSLVVALLMDGPQLEARWSARYATVLAEDPGSSILTLTCAGMIRRSRRPGSPHTSVVGLWKDREGRAQELNLDDGYHALVLCLSSKSIEQRTLDSRSDGGNLVEYRLSGVQQVRAKQPPKWLEREA